ncbi:MAG: type II toxin-antitoxin system VapC family toxin [Desulfurivibrionaceae bacterium]
MLYVDTSVLAAYYCPEALSDKAEAAILAAEQPAISSLTQVELVSALGRKVREKEITREIANRIVNQFQAHIGHGLYHWLPIEHHHYEKAFQWVAAFSTPLRTLDGLHLAVAAGESARLLTADQQLAKSAKLLGLAVTLIR